MKPAMLLAGLILLLFPSVSLAQNVLCTPIPYDVREITDPAHYWRYEGFTVDYSYFNTDIADIFFLECDPDWSDFTDIFDAAASAWDSRCSKKLEEDDFSTNQVSWYMNINDPFETLDTIDTLPAPGVDISFCGASNFIL